MSLGIDRPTAAEESFVAHVTAGIKGWQYHDIVRSGIQFTVGLVGELQVGHDNTRLQLEICKMENRMLSTHRLIESQVLFDFPVGGFLVITLPLVDFISEEGA